MIDKRCPSCSAELVESTPLPNPCNKAQRLKSNLVCSRCRIGVHRNAQEYAEALDKHRERFYGYGPYVDDADDRRRQQTRF